MRSVLVSLLICAAVIVVRGGEVGGVLENGAIAWRRRVRDGALRPLEVKDKAGGNSFSLAEECFQLVLGDAAVMKASDFKLEGAPEERTLNPDPASPILAREDERDLSEVGIQLPIFEALVRGYLSSAAEILTLAEKRLPPVSGKLITFEIGIRFLADFLAGDK